MPFFRSINNSRVVILKPFCIFKVYIMDDYNVPVLVDAKSEYTQQLISTLTPHFI